MEQNTDQKNSVRRISVLTLILEQRDTKKAESLLKSKGLALQYTYLGRGTASSELLDYLGLGSGDKTVITSPVPKSCVPALMSVVSDGLDLHRPSHGIAFAVPLSGVTALITKQLDEEAENSILKNLERGEKQMVADTTHSLLVVMINQGYSDDVMNVAKGAGAAGGTVIHARRAGDDKSMKNWGISIQPEREMLYILVDRDKKTAIMQAIGDKCGLHTDIQGLVVSVPVDAVAGLTKFRDSIPS